MEDDPQWKATFGGIRPSVEDMLPSPLFGIFSSSIRAKFEQTKLIFLTLSVCFYRPLSESAELCNSEGGHTKH